MLRWAKKSPIGVVEPSMTPEWRSLDKTRLSVGVAGATTRLLERPGWDAALPLDRILAHLARRHAIGLAKVLVKLGLADEAGLERHVGDGKAAVEQ